MSCSTKGIINKYVKHEEIVNYIRQKIDLNVKDYVETTTSLHMILRAGFITFTYNGINRTMFYYYDDTKDNQTSLSMGHTDDSMNIIVPIISYFGGGYCNENDCESNEYVEVPKEIDDSIQPIQYVTMEDIYKKFGGIVIITDRKVDVE